MTDTKPPSSGLVDEFEMIESALMETARGRRFLQEYLRRRGAPETTRILEAISALKALILEQRNHPSLEKLRLDLIEMSKAISRTREEIAAIRPENGGDSFLAATEELDAIVRATEKATTDILTAAEEIQETAWRLREAGASESECDLLDEHATNIYMACSFQDITGQRTTKVVQVLRYLEARINAMIDIWRLDDLAADTGETQSLSAPKTEGDSRPDAHLLNGPQLEGKGLEQECVDQLLADVDEGDVLMGEVVPDPAGEVAGDTASSLPAEPVPVSVPDDVDITWKPDETPEVSADDTSDAETVGQQETAEGAEDEGLFAATNLQDSTVGASEDMAGAEDDQTGLSKAEQISQLLANPEALAELSEEEDDSLSDDPTSGASSRDLITEEGIPASGQDRQETDTDLDGEDTEEGQPGEAEAETLASTPEAGETEHAETGDAEAGDAMASVVTEEEALFADTPLPEDGETKAHAEASSASSDPKETEQVEKTEGATAKSEPLTPQDTGEEPEEAGIDTDELLFDTLDSEKASRLFS